MADHVALVTVQLDHILCVLRHVSYVCVAWSRAPSTHRYVVHRQATFDGIMKDAPDRFKLASRGDIEFFTAAFAELSDTLCDAARSRMVFKFTDFLEHVACASPTSHGCADLSFSRCGADLDTLLVRSNLVQIYGGVLDQSAIDGLDRVKSALSVHVSHWVSGTLALYDSTRDISDADIVVFHDAVLRVSNPFAPTDGTTLCDDVLLDMRHPWACATDSCVNMLRTKCVAALRDSAFPGFIAASTRLVRDDIAAWRSELQVPPVDFSCRSSLCVQPYFSYCMRRTRHRVLCNHCRAHRALRRWCVFESE
jgi:hypothetical protein